MSFTVSHRLDILFRLACTGMETLDAIERVPVDAKYRPQQPVRIKAVTMHANPIADSEQ